MKKRTYIFIIIILTIIVLLSLQIKLIIERHKVYSAYADYIESHSLYEGFEKGELENNETRLVFSLEYIDEDNLPELVVGWTKALNETPDICILKYVDGNVKQLGPFGHYNCIDYIPNENILCECNSWAGETSYRYFRINDKGENETLCEAYMPMNDEQEIYTIEEKYYVSGNSVSKEKYNAYVEEMSSNGFVSWSGEHNNYSLDVLNKYNLSQLRKGKIEIAKNVRVESERENNSSCYDYYDIDDFVIDYSIKSIGKCEYPVLSSDNVQYDYVLTAINQDYLEIITEAKKSNDINAITCESIDIDEIDNLAYVTINERISKSSKTFSFNKTYVIEKYNKDFANLNDIFLSNIDFLANATNQICEVDNNLDCETVYEELFLASDKRNISWSIVNGKLKIDVDSNVFSDSSKNINYKVNIMVEDYLSSNNED